MKNKIQKIFSTLLASLMIAGCGNLTTSSSEDHSSHNHSSSVEHSSSENNHSSNTNK